jgi:predicted nuclease of predicted toxin-antitoxin system
MLLYADENFPYPVVEALRQLGHDVLTAQDDGMRSVPDSQILDRAHALGRAVLTFDRRHFLKLHRQGTPHSGMVLSTDDKDYPALAARIDAALKIQVPGRWSVRINRPTSAGTGGAAKKP